MANRRHMLALGIIGGTALLGPLRAGLAAQNCASAADAEAIGSALLDKYVAAVNAHDTSSFGDIHTESYIQHSGRSPNGLAALIENFRGISARMPDVQARVEDRDHRRRQGRGAHDLFRDAHPAVAGHRPHRAALRPADHRYLARRKREICRALGYR
jgi:hypothetical protein